MCGIIAYTGRERNAAKVIRKGLKKLEYRGYDSVGIGIVGNPAIKVTKDAGDIDSVHRRLNFDVMGGTTGIGHTRWATHGPVNHINAHPHLSCDGRIAVVHNGVIENYVELKKQLEEQGHHFISETDTEIIAHLLENHCTSSLLNAIFAVVPQLSGYFAFTVISSEEPHTVIGVRKENPLVVGCGEGENFIASDLTPLLEYTRHFLCLEDLEVVKITPNSIELYNAITRQKIKRSPGFIDWVDSSVTRGDYPHYMLKEIVEEPEVILRAFDQDTALMNQTIEMIQSSERLLILGAGTSYHAGLIGTLWLLTQANGVPLPFPILASEFANYQSLIDDNTLVLGISQSGETFDVLSAYRICSENPKTRIISIVNVPGSSVARQSHVVLPMHAGPEIGVAATKTFVATLCVFLQLVHILQGITLTNTYANTLAQKVRLSLQMNWDRTKELARSIIQDYSSSVYFFARGQNSPLALEGALKMKEISYLHAEGLAAGELKHGTLALIEAEPPTPTIWCHPNDNTYRDLFDNINEVKLRGGRIIAVTDQPDENIHAHCLPIPSGGPYEYPLLQLIPLQLLAYHVATQLHRPIDKPRHLAKAVTVK
ncbi:MAG: glutamine--fructose-6-phosphate transaminase (isomerizing) [Candidatus Heimdallarchaeota archaeon]